MQNTNMASIWRSMATAFLVSLVAIVSSGFGQSVPATQSPVSHTERPIPPTRDPNTPGYVTAKELPDGSVPPANVDGNFIIGPTHNAVAEVSVHGDLANGTVIEFTMKSSESKIYPGIARAAGTHRIRQPTSWSRLQKSVSSE